MAHYAALNLFGKCHKARLSFDSTWEGVIPKRDVNNSKAVTRADPNTFGMKTLGEQSAAGPWTIGTGSFGLDDVFDSIARIQGLVWVWIDTMTKKTTIRASSMD